jgi:hypothetical protein
MIAFLFELFALGPFVESTGNVDIGGIWVLPT